MALVVRSKVKKSVKGMPGMTGSLDENRIFPAHYKIILSDFKLSNDFKKNFFRYQWDFPKEATEKNELLIKLNHEKDDGFLKEKLKIQIINYLEYGDEGGIWTKFDDIQIINEYDKRDH